MSDTLSNFFFRLRNLVGFSSRCQFVASFLASSGRQLPKDVTVNNELNFNNAIYDIVRFLSFTKNFLKKVE